MKTRNLPLLVLALSVIAATVPAVSQPTDDTAASLQQIDASYSLTQTGWGSADRITKPGTVYVVRIDGLVARPIANHVTPTNTVIDGKLLPPAKGFLGAFGTSGDAEQVKPGQRFYLHEIKLDDNSIVFTMISLDTVATVVHGQSAQSRLRLYLKFSMPKQDAAPLTTAVVHKMSDAIFLPEGDPAATPSVQLGQSMAEVEEAMGEPQKVIDLGSKKILIYKDIKVTLVDGKVTDAE
jgi:hypothetical protein